MSKDEQSGNISVPLQCTEGVHKAAAPETVRVP